MIRNAMLTMAFGACVLGAATLFAQEEQEAKPVRFEAMVRVLDLNLDPGATLTVTLPNGVSSPAIPYKAYPYGSTFEASAGAQFRVNFSVLTYAVVRGPARFTPKASNDWQNVQVHARQGDYNLRVDDRTLNGQFEIVTPLGTFTNMKGMSKLHLGADIATDRAITDDDFTFRTLSGAAAFKGLHYNMEGMTQANAFGSVDSMGFQSSQLTGRLGDVELSLPSGNGAVTPFSLTPGAQVKITRTKPQGSDNWVVMVLTLYANGQAKNYFGYVENRGEGYSTGELIAEVLPEEPAEGGEGAEDTLADDGTLDAGDDLGTIPDEMTDFDFGDDGALL